MRDDVAALVFSLVRLGMSQTAKRLADTSCNPAQRVKAWDIAKMVRDASANIGAQDRYMGAAGADRILEARSLEVDASRAMTEIYERHTAECADAAFTHDCDYGCPGLLVGAHVTARTEYRLRVRNNDMG